MTHALRTLLRFVREQRTSTSAFIAPPRASPSLIVEHGLSTAAFGSSPRSSHSVAGSGMMNNLRSATRRHLGRGGSNGNGRCQARSPSPGNGAGSALRPDGRRGLLRGQGIRAFALSQAIVIPALAYRILSGPGSHNASAAARPGAAASRAGDVPARCRSSAAASPPTDDTFGFETGSVLIPASDKTNGGEDACFIFRNGPLTALGVSDGVGGWSQMGIDAGAYSRQLMHHAEDQFKLVSPEAEGSEMMSDPKRIVFNAVRKTQAKGSATICLVTLQGSRLRAANIGDSGFLVVRDRKVAFKSTQQQHSFNFPFQVSSVPKYR